MHSDKETGFLAASANHNQEFSKKPGFWPPARQSQRNRVFAQIYASQPRILEKTRFLATRASVSKKPGFCPHLRITTKNSRKNPVSGHPRVSLKETGFLAASTHHNQEFSKKPGFWPPARQSQRNRVFAQIYASQPRILEKTRFLATRALMLE